MQGKESSVPRQCSSHLPSPIPGEPTAASPGASPEARAHLIRPTLPAECRNARMQLTGVCMRVRVCVVVCMYARTTWQVVQASSQIHTTFMQVGHDEGLSGLRLKIVGPRASGDGRVTFCGMCDHASQDEAERRTLLGSAIAAAVAAAGNVDDEAECARCEKEAADAAFNEWRETRRAILRARRCQSPNPLHARVSVGDWADQFDRGGPFPGSSAFHRKIEKPLMLRAWQRRKEAMLKRRKGDPVSDRMRRRRKRNGDLRRIRCRGDKMRELHAMLAASLSLAD